MNATTLGSAPELAPVPEPWNGADPGLTAVDVITDSRCCS